MKFITRTLSSFSLSELKERMSFGVVDLVVGEFLLAAVAFELSADEFGLVDIEAFVFILVDPELRKHLCDLQGHQSGEDRVAGILGRSGKDCGVEFFGYVEVFGEHRLDHPPLVEAEIVDQDKEHLLAGVEQRENALLENLMAHQGMVGRGNPMLVFALDELAEAGIGVALLEQEHLVHGGVGAGEFQLPEHELAIDFHPFADRGSHVDRGGDLLEFVLIGACGLARHEFAGMEVFLEREENLHRVDGFDQIVGDA